MASLIKLLLVLAAVHIVFTMTGVMDVPGSALFNLMSGAEGWSASILVSLFKDLAISVGAVLVIAGTLLPGKHELMVFSGAFLAIATYGAGFLALSSVVFAEAEAMFGAGAGGVFTSLFVGPLFIIYIWTAVAWWKGAVN